MVTSLATTNIGVQNDPRQLARLAALRQLYAAAKTVLAWQVVLGGPLAAGLALLLLGLPSAKGLVVAWSLAVTAADLFWLSPLQKRLIERAALIQEAFDCDVLGMAWNGIKAGPRPDPELVQEQSEKYRRWAARMPPLTGWYPAEVRELPTHLARIVCQRLNCLWDANQRRHYALLVLGTLMAVLALTVLSAVIGHVSVEDLLTRMIPFLPCATLGLRQYRDQMDAAARLERLKEHAAELWRDAIGGKSAQAVSAQSRSLQDEILENRRRSPLVFDSVFRCLRGKYEEQMHYGAAELVAEARSAIPTVVTDVLLGDK